MLKKLFHGLPRKQEKDTFSLFMGVVARRKEYFIIHMNLTDSNYHAKNRADWLNSKREKMMQSQNLYFEEPTKSKHFTLKFQDINSSKQSGSIRTFCP